MQTYNYLLNCTNRDFIINKTNTKDTKTTTWNDTFSELLRPTRAFSVSTPEGGVMIPFTELIPLLKVPVSKESADKNVKSILFTELKILAEAYVMRDPKELENINKKLHNLAKKTENIDVLYSITLFSKDSETLDVVCDRILNRRSQLSDKLNGSLKMKDIVLVSLMRNKYISNHTLLTIIHNK